MMEMNMTYSLLVLSILQTFILCCAGDVPVVEVEGGILSGKYYSVANGRIINAFLGVPYASPPVGENRFKEPQPLKPWIGTWNASQYSSPCLQYTHYKYIILGEEDCLFLNVYTPKLPTNDVSLNLNVIVYIHGGALMYGTGNVKQPDHLLSSHDVVFVTINYRLGPLGFFSTGDKVVPGNNGLKDQVAALKWIQRNIAKFGGNPNKVTISGMSAGGASVHHHFISPLSEGLFHRGIAESGSLLMPWTIPKNVPEKCKKLATLVGCPVGSSDVTIECLRKRPAVQIVKRLQDLMGWRYNPYSPIGPVVESGDNAFLPDHPYKLLRAGKIKDIPLLISTTEEEGLYPAAEFIGAGLLNEIEDRWLELAPHILDFNYTVPKDRHEEVSTIVRQKYLGDKKISLETAKQFIDMVGDRLFNAYITHAGKIQASLNKSPVYYYRFSYRGTESLTETLGETTENYGVSHGDDTQYVLKVHYAAGNKTESDRAMIDVMVHMWTTFFDSGVPEIRGVQWKPISNNLEDFNYVKINSPTEFETISTTDASDLFNFWSNTLNDFPDFSTRDEL